MHEKLVNFCPFILSTHHVIKGKKEGKLSGVTVSGFLNIKTLWTLLGK